MSQVSLNYIENADVLHVRLHNNPIIESVESASDASIVINKGHGGKIVGVIILDASEMTSSYWTSQPDITRIPPILGQAVLDWIDERIDEKSAGPSPCEEG